MWIWGNFKMRINPQHFKKGWLEKNSKAIKERWSLNHCIDMFYPAGQITRYAKQELDDKYPFKNSE